MPEPDPRAARRSELQIELNKVRAEFLGLEPGSQEHEEVLQRFAPILGAMMALEEELGEN